MQPHHTSLAHYISEGYRLATGKDLPNKLAEFDTGILLLDDIIDDSKERNGKQCEYLTQGLGETIISGIEKIANSSIYLDALMQNTHIGFKHSTLLAMQELILSVCKGEKIDQNVKTVDDYFEMTTAFTGQHIATGVKIGHYIANINPKKELLEACESAGRIRQIVDDYEDYYYAHHEPFGDFVNHKNRLPELLFQKDRLHALMLISSGQYEDAREYILDDDIRKKLFTYCLAEEKRINQLDNRALQFIIDYDTLIH